MLAARELTKWFTTFKFVVRLAVKYFLIQPAIFTVLKLDAQAFLPDPRVTNRKSEFAFKKKDPRFREVRGLGTALGIAAWCLNTHRVS